PRAGAGPALEDRGRAGEDRAGRVRVVRELRRGDRPAAPEGAAGRRALHRLQGRGREARATHGLILGIESSCDEMAAAVVRGGREILASVVRGQAALHRPYGGVVPEIASRDHVRSVSSAVAEALSGAGVAARSLDAVAVTAGPGLVGSLLVGLSFAKALA